MKRSSRILICFFTLLISGCGDSVTTTSDLTFGGLLNGLESVIKQMESSAHSLLEQGNASVAQQQMLFAAMLRATVDDMKKAYADSLNKTFKKLNTTEQNTFNDLQTLLQNTADIEKRTARDAQDLVYKSQGSINQIMDRIGIFDKHPVYFGFQTRDFKTNPAPNPTDIEILGFLLADPQLNYKKPEIEVGGYNIPPENIDIQNDRIKVELPDPLKRNLNFANEPCEPLKSFGIKITVHYLKVNRSLFFFKQNKETTVVFEGNGLPGSEQFEVNVHSYGIREATEPVKSDFSESSGYVSFDCEQTATATAIFTAPKEAREINPTSEWVDVVNAKSQSPGTVATVGNVANVVGTISGLDKQGVKLGFAEIRNCPGGGHGRLIIKGTYILDKRVEHPFEDDMNAVFIKQPVQFVLTSDSILTYSKCKCTIKRKGCPNVFDEIELNVPNDTDQQVTQTSRNGLYKMTYRNHTLKIEAINMDQ